MTAVAHEGFGRSRGGVTTKLHATCDALGNPVHVLLTPGRRRDITQAADLIDGYAAGAVLGDKGYDADALVAQIAEAGAVVVIQSRKNRGAPREHDRTLSRNGTHGPTCGPIERFFNRLKQCRRVATRYEKLGQNYLSIVLLASTLISLL